MVDLTKSIGEQRHQFSQKITDLGFSLPRRGKEKDVPLVITLADGSSIEGLASEEAVVRFARQWVKLVPER